MTVFLVILAILLLGGTALLASGRSVPAVLRRKSTGSGAGLGTRDGDSADDGGRASRYTAEPPHGMGLVEPVAGLPPVLLPDAPGAEDVDAVRFGLGLRGYRMDQVDEVLDRLAAALHERDSLISSLRSQLADRTDPDR